MLALITNRDDHTADWLILELHRRCAGFVRLNTDGYPRDWRVSWSTNGAWIQHEGGRLEMADVDVIWWRRPTMPELADDLKPEIAHWARGEAAETLEGFWRTADAKWVNHPDDNRCASNKPAQLRIAAALGLSVPDTVITNVGAELAELFRRSPHGVVCKPLTHGRIGDARLFATRVEPEAAALLGPEPCQFQALVPKRYDVRVTVIGSDVFATKIHAPDQLDWRRAALGDVVHATEVLPAETASQCLRLTREFGLKFAAIDLCRTADGEYVFFEVNPNGQWAWIEQATQQPLRAALADLLLACA